MSNMSNVLTEKPGRLDFWIVRGDISFYQNSLCRLGPGLSDDRFLMFAMPVYIVLTGRLDFWIVR